MVIVITTTKGSLKKYLKNAAGMSASSYPASSSSPSNTTISFPHQVYYERVNTHSASTSFAHACCGQRDASRNLVLDTKTPITKVRFSKGFAFANIEAASGKL